MRIVLSWFPTAICSWRAAILQGCCRSWTQWKAGFSCISTWSSVCVRCRCVWWHCSMGVGVFHPGACGRCMTKMHWLCTKLTSRVRGFVALCATLDVAGWSSFPGRGFVASRANLTARARRFFPAGDTGHRRSPFRAARELAVPSSQVAVSWPCARASIPAATIGSPSARGSAAPLVRASPLLAEPLMRVLESYS